MPPAGAVDGVAHRMEDDLDRIGVESQVGAGRGLFDRSADHVFDFGIEQVDREDGLALRVLIADVAAERGADVFGEEDGVFFGLGPFAEGFEDCAKSLMETCSWTRRRRFR